MTHSNALKKSSPVQSSPVQSSPVQSIKGNNKNRKIDYTSSVMAMVSQKETVIYEAEKTMQEAQYLLQEILRDLSEDPETFLNEDLLSLIKEVRNTKDNIIQRSPSDRDKVQEDRPKINTSTKKRGISHTHLDMNSLDQLSSQDINRHIKNLGSNISKAKEETKVRLRIKLQALLNHKESRIKNGTW